MVRLCAMVVAQRMDIGSSTDYGFGSVGDVYNEAEIDSFNFLKQKNNTKKTKQQKFFPNGRPPTIPIPAIATSNKTTNQ